MDNRWIAPYYSGLQDFQKGQHVWSVGTVGDKCDNRIFEEILTGEMKLDDYGYLNFLTQGIDNNIRCWNRFGSFGCSVFFTKEEAEIALKERFEEVYNNKLKIESSERQMTIEDAYKKEMNEYIKSAIEYLEMALNVVECDDKFNDGQSEELNQIYDKVSNTIKSLEDI